MLTIIVGWWPFVYSSWTKSEPNNLKLILILLAFGDTLLNERIACFEINSSSSFFARPYAQSMIAFIFNDLRIVSIILNSWNLYLNPTERLLFIDFCEKCDICPKCVRAIYFCWIVGPSILLPTRWKAMIVTLLLSKIHSFVWRSARVKWYSDNGYDLINVKIWDYIFESEFLEQLVQIEPEHGFLKPNFNSF